MESVSLVVAQFNLGVDVKYAEQQVKDKVTRIRRNLPQDIEEPLIMRYDPADMPIARVALSAELKPNDLYDLAKEEIKVGFQQVNDVASVQIIGGQRREIQVELDRNKLNNARVSTLAVANAIKSAGMNVPVGKHEKGASEMVFRTVAQFTDIDQISNAVVQFSGDVGSAISVKTLGTVSDGSEEKTTIGYLYAPVNGNVAEKSGFFSNKRKQVKREMKPALFLEVYKQSGSNTVAVVDGLIDRIQKINDSMKDRPGKPKLTLIYDGAKIVRMNLDEVRTTILIGIGLAIFVVYLFLGNLRSTFITGIALPNSILGAFILMYIMGYTINVITLLALSLTVGLLVDDAIVVRENIFRKLEAGMKPARCGGERHNRGHARGHCHHPHHHGGIRPDRVPERHRGPVLQAVRLHHRVRHGHQPVRRPYRGAHSSPPTSPARAMSRKNIVIRNFERFQRWLEALYGNIMSYALAHPFKIIMITTVILAVSVASAPFIKMNFMSSSDNADFMVQIQMPSGTSLDGTTEVALKVTNRIIATAPEMINYLRSRA